MRFVRVVLVGLFVAIVMLFVVSSLSEGAEQQQSSTSCPARCRVPAVLSCPARWVECRLNREEVKL
jgi:hypothetical protein